MAPRVKSTHVHDNNGTDDRHLFPMVSPGGTVDWHKTMELLRSRGEQCPLLLELKDPGDKANPLEAVHEVFERLENA